MKMVQKDNSVKNSMLVPVFSIHKALLVDWDVEMEASGKEQMLIEV